MGEIPADTFAVRLLLARHHAGRLSQRQAAERCGLNYASWSNWEEGRKPRDRVEIAEAVAQGLGIDFDWMCFGGPLANPRGRPILRRIEHGDGAPYVRPRDSRPKGYPGPTGPPDTGRRPRRRSATESGQPALVPVTLRAGVSHNE